MVHLAIDAVGMKQAGVKTILLDVLAAVEQHEDIDKATVFTSPRSARDFEFPSSYKIREIPQPLAESFALRLAWYEYQLSRRVREVGADILLCLHNAGKSPPGIPHATFVQRPLVYPEDARRRVHLRHRYRMPVIRWAVGRSCRSAETIFVHTETERKTISGLFDIPTQRISVVLPPARTLPTSGAHPDLRPMRDAPEGMRLLFVGQLFAHKNIRVVLEAMRMVKDHLPAATLFVSGPPAQGLEPAPGMVYLGAVPDRALREAYELATVLVMPSLYETIGLPMPEAMSVGTPVLAADRPYAHDVCEDAACFFDPLSSRCCAEQIVRLLADVSLRSVLAQRGFRLVERRRASRPYEPMLATTLAMAKCG